MEGVKAKPMAKTLELYFDFSSPFAYLATTQAADVARRNGATLVWRPMLLGGVFKAIGTPDAPILSWSEQKRQYYFTDLRRWAAHWSVPFRFPSRFPMSSIKALRVWLALPEPRRDAFLHAAMRAYWGEDRDISDDAVLAELVGEGAAEVIAKTQSPEIKEALKASTQRAIDAGVFGAPTWVVDGKELYWGQDRIELVERELRRA
jgi:2-hydroxychromene-2-carboxylate isomerase